MRGQPGCRGLRSPSPIRFLQWLAGFLGAGVSCLLELLGGVPELVPKSQARGGDGCAVHVARSIQRVLRRIGHPLLQQIGRIRLDYRGVADPAELIHIEADHDKRRLEVLGRRWPPPCATARDRSPVAADP